VGAAAAGADAAGPGVVFPCVAAGAAGLPAAGAAGAASAAWADEWPKSLETILPKMLM